MKLIIIVFILIFCSDFTINAESFDEQNKLIISEGIGDNSYLKLDNCKLINNNVEWDITGSYYANYYNQESKTYFEREVVVTNYNDLNKGLALYSENFIEEDTIDYRIYDMIGDDNSFIVVGSIDSHDPVEHTPFYQNYAFISYYQNNELIWRKVYTDSYSFISSVKVTDMGIICLLSYVVGEIANMKLIEFSHTGNILREKDITTNGIDRGHDLYLKGDFIYIFCSSDSTDGDFYYNYDETSYLAVLKIRYDNLNLEDFLCFGNKGMNYYNYYDVYNNTIYLLMRSNGSMGEFKNFDGDYKGYFMISFPLSFDYYNYAPIEVNEFVDNFYVEYNNIILLTNSYINKQARVNIYLYSSDLNYRNKYYWEYPETEVIITNVDGAVNYLEQMIITFDIRDQSQKKFSGILMKDHYEEFSYAVYDGTNFDCLNVKFNSDESIYFYGFNDNMIGYVEAYTIRSRANKTYNIGNRDYVVRKIYINEFPVKVLGEPKRNLIFGHYDDEYLYTNDRLTCILLDQFYVDANINVKDRNTYDTGVSLEFNGYGYLNDEEIDSRYEINDIGNYCLIVYGNSGERKVINFNTKNLSLVYKPQEKIDLNTNVTDVTTVSAPPEYKVNNHSRITNEEGYTYEVIIVAIIISLGVLLGFLIPKRRKDNE